MRFLGLALGETVPDTKTIWNFRNELANAGEIEPLFALFTRELETHGIVTHKGIIVDATFVDAPKQRNTREENKRVKAGEVPEDWSENKRRQPVCNIVESATRCGLSAPILRNTSWKIGIRRQKKSLHTR
jgi:IS5 family transposase